MIGDDDFDPIGFVKSKIIDDYREDEWYSGEWQEEIKDEGMWKVFAGGDKAVWIVKSDYYICADNEEAEKFSKVGLCSEGGGDDEGTGYEINEENVLLFSGCEEGPPGEPSVEVAEGYRVSYFVAPNGLTTPSDIVTDSDGNIYVTEIRGGGISRISQSGDVEFWSDTDTGLYSMAVDSDDNFYGYFFPTGTVYKVTIGGEVSTLAENFEKIGCMSESTIALNSKDEVYVLRNDEKTGKGNLQKISRSGAITEVLEIDHCIEAIEFNGNDELFATRGESHNGARKRK